VLNWGFSRDKKPISILLIYIIDYNIFSRIKIMKKHIII